MFLLSGLFMQAQTTYKAVNASTDTIVKKGYVDSTKKEVAKTHHLTRTQRDSIRQLNDQVIFLKKEVKESADLYLFDELPAMFYFWGMFFVFLGVCLSWALKALFGMTTDKNTSNTWDWKEFLKPANVKKRVASFIASFIAAFFTIRFAADWFGTDATMAYCAGVGLALDYILAWYWNKRKSFAPKVIQEEPEIPEAKDIPNK